MRNLNNMNILLSPEFFKWFLYGMMALAVIVFIALNFVNAGYGIMSDNKWGLTISNKVAWMLMEAPVFIVMCLFFAFSDRTWQLVPLVFFLLFQTHYLQRSFIFPWLIKGKSRMPLLIMFMGIFFNIANAYMQGAWIFVLSPADMYGTSWLATPQFIIGTVIFLAGFVINLHSDYIIRHLRKDGDTRHYFPEKGLFHYVTCANYFGELMEWLGFAILTWSLSGLVFFIWTFANLVPRSSAVYHKYLLEFPQQMAAHPRKRVFPFIY